MTPAEVLKFAEKHGAKMVDFKFVDLPGIWQHTTMPIAKLRTTSFKDGYGFDGSSIRGWQPINASDMIFIPDPDSAQMDPFYAMPTLSLICDIVDAITKQPYTRDPRTIAAKAEAYLKSTGIGDTSYFGPEPEFFVFDEVRYSEGPNRASYMVDSVEGAWNSGREESPNLGYKPAHKGGYFPVPPTDTLTDLRAEMAVTLEAVGITVEVFHHEVATGGQCELSMKFDSCSSHGRPDHVVQVRRQERRPQARQDRDVHAEADLRRQRLGHALPPVDLEGRQAPLRRRQVRAASRRRRSTTSAAS